MLEILYEDKNIVFCVKPTGLSSETDVPKILKEQLGCDIYTLHRLDIPVSGVIAYAKNKHTASDISKKIAENSDFFKTYLLICEGHFNETEGIMEDFLFKDSKKNKSFVVKKERKGVKKAILEYKVLNNAILNGKIYSLVSVKLRTGRTHQIRVQFSSRKHPLIGDGKYGSKVNCKIALFSHKIEIGDLSVSKNPSTEENPWNIFN